MIQIHTPSRLAVIVHADVVGSTLLVQKNEQLAHNRILDSFKSYGVHIAAYGGEVRELRGDALLAEFARASDAVLASLAFQREQNLLCNSLNDDVLPWVRVGIAMGEVVIADGTITGSGVVLAQRLEQLAGPGGIVIQGAAHETLPRRLPLEFSYLGEKTLKGFEAPTRAYSVDLQPDEILPPPEHLLPPVSPNQFAAKNKTNRRRLIVLIAMTSAFVICTGIWTLLQNSPSEASLPATTASQAHTEKPTLAVLRFDNLSNDETQDYFTDGIVVDLITDLSKMSGLFVIATNSSFEYKSSSADYSQIASDLGVRYLLAGSVRRAGDQLRINARLIDSQTSENIWSERYDRKLVNVFEIQDEVSKDIVTELAINLTRQEREYIERPIAENIDAYDILLQGMELVSRFNPEDNLEGRVLFQKAIALDPNYARAYAGIALAHAYDVLFLWSKDRKLSMKLGEEAAHHALRLDDSLPQAYIALYINYQNRRQFDKTLSYAKRAVELAPSYADGHAHYAGALTNAGHHKKALASIEIAKHLDPHYSHIYLYVESIATFHLDQFSKAKVLIQESVNRNSEFDRTQLFLASTLGHLGEIDDADWALQEALTLKPELTLQNELKNSPLKHREDRERYIEGLRKAGLR